MKTILSNLTASGTVAVFYYPEVGLHHFAVVTKKDDQYVYLEETNFKSCQHGIRKIPKNDPSLLGYFTP